MKKKDKSKKNVKRKTLWFINSWLTCLLNPSAEQIFGNNPSTGDRTAQENDQISARGQGGALTFGTQSPTLSFHEFNWRQCAVRTWPLEVHMCHRDDRQGEGVLVSGKLESCFWNCWDGSTLCCGSGLVLLVCVCVFVCLCWLSCICVCPFFALLVLWLA